jgi:RHS repeat-associated protein
MPLLERRYKFTGKERDTESGLDYFGARYYASSMGRWMSPDKPFAD